MRLIFFVAAIGVMLAAGACTSDPTAPLDQSFTLGVGETAHISDEDLSVTFVIVREDSRCPTQLTCVWAGNGQVELDVHTAGATSTIRLNTNEGAKEVVVGAYRVRLAALTPVPVNIGPINAGSYRVSLVVSHNGTVCTEEARPALMVGLADSLTGATSGFTGVTIKARQGTYADSLVLATYPSTPFDGPVALAYERKGTYDVTVKADGYTLWSKSGVEVTGDQCHVATVGLTARLTR